MPTKLEIQDEISYLVKQEVATTFRGMGPEWFEYAARTIVENGHRIKALEERVKQLEERIKGGAGQED